MDRDFGGDPCGLSNRFTLLAGLAGFHLCMEKFWCQIGSIFPNYGFDLRVDMEFLEFFNIFQSAKNLAFQFPREIDLALRTVVKAEPNDVVPDVFCCNYVKKHCIYSKGSMGFNIRFC